MKIITGNFAQIVSKKISALLIETDYRKVFVGDVIGFEASYNSEAFARSVILGVCFAKISGTGELWLGVSGASGKHTKDQIARRLGPYMDWSSFMMVNNNQLITTKNNSADGSWRGTLIYLPEK